jgi:pimeloyl-ACP methyl ester carboxylesterase
MNHTSSDRNSTMADVNGTRLYCEVVGSGPPLVLIHGYTLDTRMWDDQTEAFADKYAVIRYDLRGFGRSALPTGEPYAHHDDLKALLECLGIAKAHIVGLSLGGAIAVNFALAHPEATASLVLVDVSGLDGYEWPEELDRWFTAIHAAARRGDMEQAKQLWLDTEWFTPAREQPEVAARLKEIVSGYSGWHFINADSGQGLNPPANARLGAIRAPTLVIVGERDLPFYNLPLADRLEQGIPHAQKVIIPEAGHMSNMEVPHVFNRIVLSFLVSTRSVV